MAGENQPPGGWRAFAGFIQQGQVLLALAVAASGLMFTFNEQRRVELGLNRTAVETARGETIRAEFEQDPHNTLAEFRATFPEHAFCAALGFFVAENGRLRSSRLDRPGEDVRRMNDAVLLEVGAVAGEAGIGAEEFAAFRQSAIAQAESDSDEFGCASVRAPRGAGTAFSASECLLAIDSFGQNECNIARWTRQRIDEIEVERVATGPAAVDGPSLPATAAVGPEPPGAACGGVSPLVFTQFTGSDRPRIEALRDALLQAGWQMAAAESVPSGRTSGDLRIYWEAQRACAEHLAAIVSALPGVDRPIQVISLADRYNGLPPNQMELWLPQLD